MIAKYAKIVARTLPKPTKLQKLAAKLQVWSEVAAKRYAVDPKVVPGCPQGRPTAPPRCLQGFLGG